MKGAQVDFLSYKGHEVNPSPNDKSGGNDYLVMCL
jgi:hypothetical protein